MTKMIRVLSMIESHWPMATRQCRPLTFRKLLYFIAILDLINEDLGSLKLGI